MTKRVRLLTPLFFLFVACTLTRGSGLVVGETRPSISAADVKIYTKPPENFEEIAIISADSRNDFASKQNLSDAAVLRLKEEAAKLGANGIILEGIGDYQVGSTGVAFVPATGSAIITGSSTVRTGKEVRGLAIYVASAEEQLRQEKDRADLAARPARLETVDTVIRPGMHMDDVVKMLGKATRTTSEIVSPGVVRARATYASPTGKQFDVIFLRGVVEAVVAH